MLRIPYATYLANAAQNYQPPDEVPPQTGGVGWDQSTGQFYGGQPIDGPQGPYAPSTNPYANGKMGNYVIGTNPKPMFPGASGYQDNGPGTPTTGIFPGAPAGGGGPNTPVIDAYGRVMDQNIAGINQSFAAEEAAINAHYDAAKNQLNQNYQKGVGDVNNEGADTMHDLGVLGQDSLQQNAQANGQVAAQNAHVLAATKSQNAHDTRALAAAGVKGAAAAPYTAAVRNTIASERAQGATDATYSTRLGQLAQQTINDRQATSKLITQGSLDDLRTLLNRGLSNIDLSRADATAKANIEKIKSVAAAKSNYAQEVATRIAYVNKQRAASGGKPLTFANKSQIAEHTNPPNYSNDFRSLLNSGNTTLAQWGSDAMDSLIGTDGRAGRTPDQLYGELKKAGSIKGLSDDEYTQALTALDAARREWIATTRNNNAWLAAHGFKA